MAQNCWRLLFALSWALASAKVHIKVQSLQSIGKILNHDVSWPVYYLKTMCYTAPINVFESYSFNVLYLLNITKISITCKNGRQTVH